MYDPGICLLLLLLLSFSETIKMKKKTKKKKKKIQNCGTIYRFHSVQPKTRFVDAVDWREDFAVV